MHENSINRSWLARETTTLSIQAMAKLLQTLIPILFLLAVAATTGRSQTTSFTYDFDGKKPTDLTLQGNADFPSNSTFLRLTDALPAQAGRALHSNPVQFWNSRGQVDFETTVNFIITPDSDNNPAHGLAFFVAPVGSTIPCGSVGYNLGIFDSNGNSPGVFAVVFSPLFSAWWRAIPHVGINIGSRSSVNITGAFDALVGQQVNARINYVGATKLITVVVTANSQRLEVSYQYDLSNFLDQQVQVGLSASTGQHVAKHDIVSWYFTATMVNNGAGAKSRKYLGNVIKQYV